MTPMSDVAQTVRAFPVSVKGVLIRDGRVLLLKNEREEWELPGGKLELGEEPPVCVAREITEETGLPVTTGPILDAWQYHIREGRDVLIVTYGCHPEGSQSPTLSNEHKEVGFFTQAEVGDLDMPAGYKHSIQSWFARLAAADDIEA
jgi:8-oxo-dGTP pyrophosphatase MutT (NUDIX family)